MRCLDFHIVDRCNLNCNYLRGILNPEINEYINLSRRLYLQATIHVVTNFNAYCDKNLPEDF